MLHDPARHEPLIEAQWDETAAHACIAGIMREVLQTIAADKAFRPLNEGNCPLVK